eukprot:9916803-Heterocapsa_arctica.AAC.1
MEAAMSATPEGADRVRQSAERIGAHVARAQERDDGEQSSKRQRVTTEGGNDETNIIVANPIDPIDVIPNLTEININQHMLDAPAAPRAPAQTRLRPTDEDGGPAAHKKIKGQQPTSITSTGTTEVRDTMDRPNDPGGASSNSPHIIVIQDIPTVTVRKFPTMPTRAERATQQSAQDD